MNFFMRRIRYIFLKVDSVYLPLISGLVAFFFGLILLLPFDTFATSLTYYAMAVKMPEPYWGSTFFNINWLTQAYISLAGLFLWSFVSTMVFLSNPIAPAVLIYPVFATLCLGRFYRCHQDKGRL